LAKLGFPLLNLATLAAAPLPFNILEGDETSNVAVPQFSLRSSSVAASVEAIEAGR
jgi:hypothetical protein